MCVCVGWRSLSSLSLFLLHTLTRSMCVYNHVYIATNGKGIMVHTCSIYFKKIEREKKREGFLCLLSSSLYIYLYFLDFDYLFSCLLKWKNIIYVPE